MASSTSCPSNIHSFIAPLSPTSCIWYGPTHLTLNFPGLISFHSSYFNTSCPGWNLFSFRCLSCHALHLFCVTSVAHCANSRFSSSLFRLCNLSLRLSMLPNLFSIAILRVGVINSASTTISCQNINWNGVCLVVTLYVMQYAWREDDSFSSQSSPSTAQGL